ncbi:hypothetical protein PG995_004800 [Apiospora arundinis]
MPDALIPQFRVGRRITRQRAQHFTVQMLPTTLHIGKSEDPQDSTHLITTGLGNRRRKILTKTHFLDSMQWLCEFPRRKVYKLYKDEPRVHIPAGIIICAYCLCTGISASERHPPGTQLFGAYGQPLSGLSNAQPGGPYSTGPPGYDQPLPLPTGSFNSYLEERGDMGSVAGMQRLRPPEEEHGIRLPPPTFSDDNSRRRSSSSSSSPNHLAPYAPLAVQGTQPSGYDSRTQPPRGSSSGPPGSGRSANSVMSLENIMESGNDIQGWSLW